MATDRSDAGNNPQESTRRAANDAAASASEHAGLAAAAEEGRSGEDARRRGWFWHWNTIITQYAPLLGLKGVGLLNSYTVWTDRREESPHRGYAFPSQQSEADFYGEDRAELITINKILVALDLIEIRKEMVTRVDERGRRWRVPHNLYRVKDHRDGYSLTSADVLRVVELAARDRAVYRYIRRIFSPRFAPIDADNVWHQILPTVRASATWQRLASRASDEERRASARTKAGHATRARAGDSAAGDTSASTSADAQRRQQGDISRDSESEAETDEERVRTTSVERANRGSATDVAPSNDGLPAGAEAGNNGLGPLEPTIADDSNRAAQGDVAESNTTYNQDSSTTTTTTVSQEGTEGWRGEPAGTGVGPLPEPAPAVVACFEAANGRPASSLERELLAELEAAFDAAARRAGATGPDWLVAAIREAVASGSRFVAPKRVREILTRWSAQPDRLRPGAARPEAPPAAGAVGTHAYDAPDFPLPHGHGAGSTWQFTLRLLSASLGEEELTRLFVGSAIVAYQAGTVTVRVGNPEAAERLSGEYYGLVSRKLAEAMRRPVRVEFVPVPSGEPLPGPAGGATVAAAPAAAGRSRATAAAASGLPASRPLENLDIPRFMLPAGLSNLQVWAAAQEDLARRLSPAAWEACVRPAVLLGIQPDGRLVLGAPNAFARGRLASRLRADVEAALSVLLERPVEIEVVVTHDWLRQPEASGDADIPGAASGTGD